MSEDTRAYRLKSDVNRVVASDVRIARDDEDLPTTVELTDDEAESINASRDEPILEPAGGASSAEDTDADGGDD